MLCACSWSLLLTWALRFVTCASSDCIEDVCNATSSSEAQTKSIKRVFLWSAQRSGSSAFARSFMERNDTLVFFEWLHDAYYYGPEKRSTNFKWPSDQRLWLSPGEEGEQEFYDDDRVFMRYYWNYDSLRYSKFFERYQQIPPRGKSLNFIKDMALYIVPYGSTPSSFVWPEELDNFQHTFLIRSPQMQVPSLVRMLRKERQAGAPVRFDIAEVGVQQLYTLFHAVRQRTNTTPAVIDIDDVLRNPVVALSEYCRRIGIDFDDDMLYWEAGWRPEFGYSSENDIWVKDVIRSTGFQEAGSTKRCRSNDAACENAGGLPSNMKQTMEDAMEFYNEMLTHKIHVP